MSLQTVEYIIGYANKFGINPNLLCAIVDRESSFRDHVLGDGGHSIGLMQVTKGAFQDYLSYAGDQWPKFKTWEELSDPVKNLNVGIWYWNNRIPVLLKNFGYEDSLRNRIIAYNSETIHAIKDSSKLSSITKSYIAFVEQRLSTQYYTNLEAPLSPKKSNSALWIGVAIAGLLVGLISAKM